MGKDTFSWALLEEQLPILIAVLGGIGRLFSADKQIHISH